MITLNGKKLAESESEFMDSLFQSGGTCVGYAKRNKKSVTILDMQRNKVGMINAHGVLCAATKLDNGKTWYSYATIKIIGEYQSYMQEVTECKALVK